MPEPHLTLLSTNALANARDADRARGLVDGLRRLGGNYAWLASVIEARLGSLASVKRRRGDELLAMIAERLCPGASGSQRPILI